jgi:tetratricopeptide (TPR) repeat protein
MVDRRGSFISRARWHFPIYFYCSDSTVINRHLISPLLSRVCAVLGLDKLFCWNFSVWRLYLPGLKALDDARSVGLDFCHLRTAWFLLFCATMAAPRQLRRCRAWTIITITRSRRRSWGGCRSRRRARLVRRPGWSAGWRCCTRLGTRRHSGSSRRLREMLGDLLLMEHKPAEALAEYKVALKLSPNRLNGLLSAGKAAEQAGLKDEAKSYYKAAAEQTSNAAHSKRPELEYAVKVAGAGAKQAGE